MDPVALQGREVCFDLDRELVLSRDQERPIGLGVATGACVREAEVVDRAALAGIERTARLERGDRLVVLVRLQVDEAEVQPVRCVGGRELHELLVDRARFAELLAAKVGEPEQREDPKILRIGGERLAERRLREIEPTLLELIAPVRHCLFDGFAVARRGHHTRIEPQSLFHGEAARRIDDDDDRACAVGAGHTSAGGLPAGDHGR